MRDVGVFNENENAPRIRARAIVVYSRGALNMNIRVLRGHVLPLYARIMRVYVCRYVDTRGYG